MPVPDANSMTAYVNREWARINQMAYDGQPTGAAVRAVENALESRKKMIDDGQLNQIYDWTEDLRVGRTFHDVNKDWLDVHVATRTEFYQFWNSTIKRSHEYLEKVSLSGVSTIILLHGAVAVGALNSLSQKTGQLSREFIVAAKVAMFGALVGIFLAATGLFIVFIFLGRMTNTVHTKLVGGRFKYKRFNSLPRYWNNGYNRSVKYGDRMVYASLFWFFVYCTAAFIILLKA